MPRPRIRPEDRQRSTRACSACKSSKVRCDSRLPCASCIKRGRATSCKYSGIDRRRRSRAFGAVHDGDIGHHVGTPTGSLRRASTSQLNSSAFELASSPSVLLPSVRTPPPTSPDTTQAAESVHRDPLVNSTHADKISVVESESLSFLYFLRKTLRAFIGNIRFTDNDLTNVDHEMTSSRDIQPHECDLGVEQAYGLLDSYFEATSGLLDLFAADEIDALMAERTRLPTSAPSRVISSEDLAALDVALAIGAQAQPLTVQVIDVGLHDTLFAKAGQVAFRDMLASPSLSMVRLFLLMAFYKLGACDRNAAAMYLGIASKAADILGLQTVNTYDPLQHESRSRIFNSFKVLNVLASFVLGRRQVVPLTSVRLDNLSFLQEQAPERGATPFSAILEGCTHIENIIESLRTGTMLHVPTAERLLEQLRQWTKGLSHPIRQFTFNTTAELTSADRQAIISHVHLSCVYHFAVMLITRPFLIVYLTSRLRGRAPDHLIDDPDAASDINIKNSKMSKMAQVCVSSAICMIKALQQIKSTRFTFGNLCLVKAWTFGSSLVLGFSMFAGEPRQDIQEAFKAALGVLEDIAQISPQAKVYHNILTDFAEAIERYHQRVAVEIQKTVQYYIDTTPFLNLEQGDALQNEGLLVDDAPLASRVNLDHYAPDATQYYNDVGLEINWADLDLHLIDSNLISGSELFGELFYSVE